MKAEIEQELSHVLLTELLAYQFASPVRWIETQDVFLRDFNTERVVEIGPSPTLAGMASRTIKAKYESYDAALSLQRQVLCYSKDQKEIYYTPDPSELVTSPEPETTSKESVSNNLTTAQTQVAAPAPVSAAPVQAVDVPDEPVKAALILQTLVAHKLKRPLADIPMSKAIKDLVGGKSTVQNEILGDLGKEFGSTPEKPEDSPLQELADQFQDTFPGSLGKQSSSLIARLMSSKMPGGFSVGVARKYLQSRWGLGAGRQDSVLLHALGKEPDQRLGSEADAKSFLDAAAQVYASQAGITLAQVSSQSSGASGSAAVVDSAALDAAMKDNKIVARQHLETLARYLKYDLTKGERLLVKEKEATALLQAELDLWAEEHGEFYASGIKPVFSSLKARTYDSYWNWARQDALSMYFDIIFGKLTSVDRETVTQCIQIMNRANPTLIKFMQYHIDHTPTEKGETYELAKKLGQQLIDNCEEVLNNPPAYKDISHPTGPKTTVDKKGRVVYSEESRPAVRKLEQYVHEMAQGGELTKESQPSIKEDLSKIYKAISKQASAETKVEFQKLYAKLLDFVDKSSEIEVSKSARAVLGDEALLESDSDTDEIASLKDYSEIHSPVSSSIPPDTIPFLHIQKKDRLGAWKYDKVSSSVFLDGLEKGAVNGLSFKNKYALITGAGAGSIGAEILQGLLAGGAKVIVTTSRYSKSVTEYYQHMYSRYGAAGSTLVVVPFNQGSKQDVKALVSYIYEDGKKGGLEWDLDYVIPFAAIPEMGIELDGIDSKSELAHRIMLTNLLRLLGEISTQKKIRNTQTRPAQVILPLSPNHGTFGSDGLYSESKLGLETLFNRWYSESWSPFLTICGAVIGWTRGTGLMSGNNIIAEGIEKLGVRTFSQKEMAFNILGLMTPEVVKLCEESPIMADLNGGLQFIENLREYTNKLRSDINRTSDVRRAVSVETAIEHKIVNGSTADDPFNAAEIKPKANMKFAFPELKPYNQVKEIAPNLEGMLDLERVIVVTGFSEVGPWGNARTRWEMEAFGEFSLEGCIEMAWIMGFIKYFNGNIKGKQHTGWVDAETGLPVEDREIKKKYEEKILKHSGVRLVEPELFNGYDPKKKRLIQEVVIQHDLEPFETDKVTAEQYKALHGEFVDCFPIDGAEEYSVRVLKGAKLFIPKALRFDRLVAGQIPTGWNPKTYGIDDDVISQVDPITLYVLVATAETLLSAGITDPYEFYKYVHVSELGNCSGSGMGGVTALKGMFKDRFLDQPVQNDILQESFINTMSAWVNMLLLSSSGPIKTPVGACATALESVDTGMDTILSGKAKIVIVGGYDDFQEEGSYEFGNMNATSNADDEFAHGRTPAEMSRPTTTSRSGFMEAQGAGLQILMTAELALKMGVPIYGIVAMASTASDKIGRSVPAPGKGILTTAREYHGNSKFKSPKLDIKYRARQLKARTSQVKAWVEAELALLAEEAESLQADNASFNKEEFIEDRSREISKEAKKQIKDAQRMYGNEFWKDDSRIAPIRGALATFDLTIDDLGVCSFHGTSTKANDKNETAAIDRMMSHLGRSEGNPVYGVFQKYLTGHPKGAAGAWMLNGALQILQSGLVPGNRNADNVDKILENYEYVLFPSRSIQTDGIKAISITSFGFGQKGAQAIVVNSDYLYAALSERQYLDYQKLVSTRYKKSYRYMHNAMLNNSLFVAKSKPPYSEDLESSVYLDPLARVSLNKEKKLAFDASDIQASLKGSETTSETSKIIADMANGLTGGKGVGVDVELLSCINIDNETFIQRNFTDSEIKYCLSAPSPRASFAGTWSAKEAVFKSMGVDSKGAGASMKAIEILRENNGAPLVILHGDAKIAATRKGIQTIKVSISHDDVQSLALAISET
ncbi:hypothetical protein OGAPHI_003550 [Ogataea philodendri]|uniref:Fatty acid synthase subunit alpha n=1 Tax=Ogataea philodendri TaxID=1378263 RepID=A0A9P8P7A5_9ASCO|nr:uncharacterized protein OGAPHI_003550 [Ogataea philodendri]KAH3666371.1 hypothetical protein OGAPHI_003550 [Ogataea philodendri]